MIKLAYLTFTRLSSHSYELIIEVDSFDTGTFVAYVTYGRYSIVECSFELYSFMSSATYSFVI